MNSRRTLPHASVPPVHYGHSSVNSCFIALLFYYQAHGGGDNDNDGNDYVGNSFSELELVDNILKLFMKDTFYSKSSFAYFQISYGKY